MKRMIQTLAMCVAVTTSPALAQLDGSLGLESSGTMTLSMDVLPGPQISIIDFGNLRQTIEQGDFAKDRGLGRVSNLEGPALCVRLSESGTYRLDWTATPLISSSEIEPDDISFYQGVGGIGDGTLMHEETIVADSGGSISGLPSNPSQCDGGTGAANYVGRLGIKFEHPRDTLTNIGQYIATVTLMVTPE